MYYCGKLSTVLPIVYQIIYALKQIFSNVKLNSLFFTFIYFLLVFLAVLQFKHILVEIIHHLKVLKLCCVNPVTIILYEFSF